MATAKSEELNCYVATQLTDKPYEEMSLNELYSEKLCHMWHKHALHSAKYKLARKKWWLEENRPIPTMEELNKALEDGEMTMGEYRAARMRRAKSIKYTMRVNDRLEYAEKAEFAEAAKTAYLDELIAIEQIEQERRKKAGHPLQYDPRKRRTRNNHRYKWKGWKGYKRLPRLSNARKRWRVYKSYDKPYSIDYQQTIAVTTWDEAKFRAVTKDRGFFDDATTAAIISETLDCSLIMANKIIRTGRLTFNQCLVLGSLFEMTPKEFCDVFLNGYFREIGESGVYRAYVEDPQALLRKPTRKKKGEEDDGTDDSGDSTDSSDV